MMENITKPRGTKNPIQKTEVTTSIKENEANMHGGDELDNAALITVQQDKSTIQDADSIEDSRSDVHGNETQNLQGGIVFHETKPEAPGKDQSKEQLDDKFTESFDIVEEGEIILDVLLDKQSDLLTETKFVINKSLENHPYKDAILSFEPSSEQLSFIDTIAPPKLLQKTPLIDIDNKDDLEGLINRLKNEKEIGVDVEWSDHGYKAVTCLVQLSTKDKDYIIDVIALKGHMGLLNDIFVDPNIVKVFHAASNDLKWLQQDCDVFVVSMFDTQRAMRALGYTKLGLDFALQDYEVVKDKSMQRADFRKRPLPPKYKDYARTDSHFLIHMYQKLKNSLIEANLLLQVLNECNKDCQVVHEKIEDGPYVSVREDILKIHGRQLVALQKLNQWRHRIAQYADVNTGVVLSKNNMKSLALLLPVDAPTVLQICKSGHVKEHLQEIMTILMEAKGLMPSGVRESTSRQIFGNRGGFSNKRKVDQTEFGGSHNLGGGPKRGKKFYRNDSIRGRGKGNGRQTDSFDLRNALQKNPFNRNKNSRRGFRN